MAYGLADLKNEHGDPIFNVTLMHPKKEASDFYKKARDTTERSNLHDYYLKSKTHYRFWGRIHGSFLEVNHPDMHYLRA